MPVRLTRRHPFTRSETTSTFMPKHIDPARAFAASSSGAVGGRRWAQKSFKLRRMPRVGSDLTGVPVAGEENAHGRAPPARRNYYQAAHQRTSDGHATGSAELAGSSATLAAHELGPPPPQRRPNLLGMPLAPLAPAARVASRGGWDDAAAEEGQVHAQPMWPTTRPTRPTQWRGRHSCADAPLDSSCDAPVAPCRGRSPHLLLERPSGRCLRAASCAA